MWSSKSLNLPDFFFFALKIIFAQKAINGIITESLCINSFHMHMLVPLPPVAPPPREPPVCRICTDPARADNPLFSPCACMGTMSHVHVACLQAWIQSRYRLSHAHPLRCEICNAEFNVEVRSRYTIDWRACCKPQGIFFLVLFLVCCAAIAASVVFFVGLIFVVGLALGAGFFGLAFVRSVFCKEVIEVRPRHYQRLLRAGDLALVEHDPRPLAAAAPPRIEEVRDEEDASPPVPRLLVRPRPLQLVHERVPAAILEPSRDLERDAAAAAAAATAAVAVAAAAAAAANSAPPFEPGSGDGGGGGGLGHGRKPWLLPPLPASSALAVQRSSASGASVDPSPGAGAGGERTASPGARVRPRSAAVAASLPAFDLEAGRRVFSLPPPGA